MITAYERMCKSTVLANGSFEFAHLFWYTLMM